MNLHMENAVDNCANEYVHGGVISDFQARYMKEEKQKVRSQMFWDYVQSLNIPGFREAVAQVLERV